jgi:hypothetical protein
MMILNHRHRLGEVQQLRGLGENRAGVPQVRVDVVGGTRLAADQQGAGVRQDDRVVVHVHDPCLGRDRLGDLVGVARGRYAGADVEELADSRFPGQVADGPPEERPVGPRVKIISGQISISSSAAARSAQ